MPFKLIRVSKDHDIYLIPKSSGRGRIITDLTCHGLDKLIQGDILIEEVYGYRRTDGYGLMFEQAESSFRRIETLRCSVCGKQYKKDETSIPSSEFEKLMNTKRPKESHTVREPNPNIVQSYGKDRMPTRPKSTIYVFATN